MSAGGGRGGSIRARWPDGACTSWLCLPVALLRHARALGLDDGDVRLISALVSFQRRGADEAVFPSQETLSELCGCDVSTIERRVRKLKRLGLIEVERRARPGGARPNHYTWHGLGAALVGREAEASNPARVRGSEGAGNPAAVRGSDEGNPAPAQGGNPAAVRGSNPAPVRGEVEAGKQRQGNTHRARDFARSILDLFNDAAGTSYDGEPWLDLIAARVAEHPGLTLDDHRAVIDAAFRRAWWQGTPSPRVIFTSAQFEQARQAAAKPRRYIGVRDDGDVPLVSASSNGRGSRYTRED